MSSIGPGRAGGDAAAAGTPGAGRTAGILLHPTSLPGRFGIGDLGPAAHRWVEFLGRSGMKSWQLLPLGPTGYGDSPYQSFSAFAGNPYWVSPEALVEDGLLTATDLERTPAFPADRVDFGPVIDWKLRVLDRAFENFRGHRGGLADAFEAFRARESRWLLDFALFMALKDAAGTRWIEWDEPVALRRPEALAAARAAHAHAIESHEFRQFLFFRQWQALRDHARAAGIRIVGDAPIFVAYDSADVWAHSGLFELDTHGRPTAVAGVPPDYFSSTGQLWGNPLYRWSAIESTGFAWWIDRLRAVLGMVDVVRLDHFRGFEAYWEIPAGDATAEHGRWVKAPGRELFHALRAALGALPIIAEDLGDISPEVLELRDAFGFPGMKVLQFAFGGPATQPFLPHNHPRNCVVYTGTHDNDTTRGWYERSATDAERDHARRYLGTSGADIAWDMIRLAFASVADTAIVPFQDVLDLDSRARMNLPGRVEGNWGWRFRAEVATEPLARRLAGLAALYGR